jgi:hypothetical protein
VIYVTLSVYARFSYRRKLGREWDEERPTPDRDAFVREGLKGYDNSIRPKLILGVYIVPIGVIALLIYLTNFY